MRVVPSVEVAGTARPGVPHLSVPKHAPRAVSIDDKVAARDVPIHTANRLPFIDLEKKYSPCDTLVLEREPIRIRDPIVDVGREAEVAVQIELPALEMRGHGASDGVVCRGQDDVAALAALCERSEDGGGVVGAVARCVDRAGILARRVLRGCAEGD